MAVHWFGKLAVSLAMLWHIGISAAWLGAQTPHRTAWVQAGVAAEYGQTFLYVERKTPWRSRPVTRLYPWSLDRTARAHLDRDGHKWRARIGPLRTRWLTIRHVRWCSVLELQAGAHAGAIIGPKYVNG